AATSRGVRVSECEARAHHVSHVVDLDTVQILRAEHVNEQAHAFLVEHEITLARFFFDIQTILKSRTASRNDADAQSSRFGQAFLARHKLPNLACRRFRDTQTYAWRHRRRSCCRGGGCWIR